MKSALRQNGFTLIEIAIVMLIIGLALAATLVPVGRLFQASQISSNQERLDAAREGLLTFAAINGRPPCPDRTGDGLEDRRAVADPANFGCAANIYEGFLPWATLGVQQTDYWGTRLRYRVSGEFTRKTNEITGALPAGCSATITAPANPNTCTFEIADNGDIPVRDGQVGRTGSVFLMNPPTGAVAVVVSHGSNRLGGTGQDGTVFAAPPAGTDEALNGPALGAIAAGPRLGAAPFIVRPPLDGAPAGCNDNSATTLCNFDDQVVFIGASTLVSRVMQSGLRLR